VVALDALSDAVTGMAQGRVHAGDELFIWE
jgi:hypothetical protein